MEQKQKNQLFFKHIKTKMISFTLKLHGVISLSQSVILTYVHAKEKKKSILFLLNLFLFTKKKKY